MKPKTSLEIKEALQCVATGHPVELRSKEAKQIWRRMCKGLRTEKLMTHQKPKQTDVKRFNQAFLRLSREINVFLATCHKCGSPVRTVGIHGGLGGEHVRTTVRCYRKPK